MNTFAFKIKHVALGLLLLVITFLTVLTVYTVDQGERAVILRFGEVDSVSEPGLHFRLPFVDTIKRMNVRTVKTGGTLQVYSKDVQAAELFMSINYALAPGKVADIYAQYGLEYESRIINPQLLDKVKNAFGKYAAVDIVRTREVLSKEILEDLQRQLTPAGILVETVQIENIDFSHEYERSVEERMKAEVDVQKVAQELEREKIRAEMARTTAKGEADARVLRATAAAEEIRLKGNAEAEAIKAKTQALAQNPNYVRLIEAEQWDGKLPQTMIPTGTLPIVTPK